MRLPGNHLTGFKAGGAQIAPGDADIIIRPEVGLSLELPRPLQSVIDIGLSGPYIANDSCIVGFSQTIVNAARSTPNILTLQPGVWMVEINWQAGWSFITTTLIQLNGFYQSTGGTLSVNLLSVPSQIFANGIMNGEIVRFQASLSFPFLISADIPAAGVGATSFLSCTFNCQRMG